MVTFLVNKFLAYAEIYDVNVFHRLFQISLVKDQIISFDVGVNVPCSVNCLQTFQGLSYDKTGLGDGEITS